MKKVTLLILYISYSLIIESCISICGDEDAATYNRNRNDIHINYIRVIKSNNDTVTEYTNSTVFSKDEILGLTINFHYEDIKIAFNNSLNLTTKLYACSPPAPTFIIKEKIKNIRIYNLNKLSNEYPERSNIRSFFKASRYYTYSKSDLILVEDLTSLLNEMDTITRDYDHDRMFLYLTNSPIEIDSLQLEVEIETDNNKILCDTTQMLYFH